MLLNHIFHRKTYLDPTKQEPHIVDNSTQIDTSSDSGSDSETITDAKLPKTQLKKEIPVEQVTSNYESGKFFTIGLKLTKTSAQYPQPEICVDSMRIFDEISKDFEITRIADESDEEVVCLNDVECYKSLDPNSEACYVLERKSQF